MSDVVLAATIPSVVGLAGIVLTWWLGRKRPTLEPGTGPRVTAVIEGGGSTTVQQHQGAGETGRFAAVSACPCTAEIAAVVVQQTETRAQISQLQSDVRSLAESVRGLPPELRALSHSGEQTNDLVRELLFERRRS